MRDELLAACQAFSNGNIQACLPLLDPAVQWYKTGRRPQQGLDNFETCKAGQWPELKIIRCFADKKHIVLEGRIEDTQAWFCDIFSIRENRIIEITSYAARKEADN